MVWVRWEQGTSLGAWSSTPGVAAVNQMCPSCARLRHRHGIRYRAHSPDRQSQVPAAACAGPGELSRRALPAAGQGKGWGRAGPCHGLLVQLQGLGWDGDADKDVMLPGAWKQPCVTAQGTRGS